MPNLKLVIGTKNLSSWSLRPWFFLRLHGVSFTEDLIELDRPETHSEILRHSPAGRVPVLLDGELAVWDSLAICEYAAERLQLPDAWPVELPARAMARSVAAEMHSGFAALRAEMPFDATRRPEPKALSEAAQADVARIREIWREARTCFGSEGNWLFGRFGIADAMFAPVVLRFYGYAVPLDGPEQDYLWNLISSAVMREWIGGAFLDLAVQKPRPASTAPAAGAPRAATPSPAPTVEAAPKLSTPARTAPTLNPSANKAQGATKEPEITVKSYILPP